MRGRAAWRARVGETAIEIHPLSASSAPDGATPHPSPLRATPSPASGRRGWFYCLNVSQESILPLCRPDSSHLTRIADEPWVKLSGTT